jgi:hypothetical protein
MDWKYGSSSRAKNVWGITHKVESLPSKHKAMSSNLSTFQKKFRLHSYSFFSGGVLVIIFFKKLFLFESG